MNRGAEELRKSVTVHGAKIAMARQVGVEPYQFSHFLKGFRKPNYQQRAWFEDNLKIGWRLWDVEIVPGGKSKAKRPGLVAKPVRRASGSRKQTARGAA